MKNHILIFLMIALPALVCAQPEQLEKDFSFHRGDTQRFIGKEETVVRILNNVTDITSSFFEKLKSQFISYRGINPDIYQGFSLCFLVQKTNLSHRNSDV